jgi:hypothetical protein
MLLSGVAARTVAGRLGHARASTTLDIYAHFTQPADQHAAAIMATALTRQSAAPPRSETDDWRPPATDVGRGSVSNTRRPR